jgi:hypothetical protein
MRSATLLLLVATTLAACGRGAQPGDVYSFGEGEDMRLAWVGRCSEADDAARNIALHQYHRTRDEYEILALQGRPLADGSQPHPDEAYMPPIEDLSEGARRCAVVYPVRVPRTAAPVMRPQTPFVRIIPHRALADALRVQ